MSAMPILHTCLPAHVGPALASGTGCLIASCLCSPAACQQMASCRLQLAGGVAIWTSVRR